MVRAFFIRAPELPGFIIGPQNSLNQTGNNQVQSIFNRLESDGNMTTQHVQFPGLLKI